MMNRKHIMEMSASEQQQQLTACHKTSQAKSSKYKIDNIKKDYQGYCSYCPNAIKASSSQEFQALDPPVYQ